MATLSADLQLWTSQPGPCPAQHQAQGRSLRGSGAVLAWTLHTLVKLVNYGGNMLANNNNQKHRCFLLHKLHLLAVVFKSNSTVLHSAWSLLG